MSYQGKEMEFVRDVSKAAIMAPFGLYADWEVGKNEVVCLFMGGDGNPEDELALLFGRTNKRAKSLSLIHI